MTIWWIVAISRGSRDVVLNEHNPSIRSGFQQVGIVLMSRATAQISIFANTLQKVRQNSLLLLFEWWALIQNDAQHVNFFCFRLQ